MWPRGLGYPTSCCVHHLCKSPIKTNGQKEFCFSSICFDSIVWYEELHQFKRDDFFPISIWPDFVAKTVLLMTQPTLWLRLMDNFLRRDSISFFILAKYLGPKMLSKKDTWRFQNIDTFSIMFPLYKTLYFFQWKFCKRRKYGLWRKRLLDAKTFFSCKVTFLWWTFYGERFSDIVHFSIISAF